MHLKRGIVKKVLVRLGTRYGKRLKSDKKTSSSVSSHNYSFNLKRLRFDGQWGPRAKIMYSVYMHSRVGHPRFPNTGLDTFHNSDKIKITDSRVYSHVFIKKVSKKKIQISLI